MLANMWQRPITGPLLILMNGRIDHHRSFFLHCAGGYCSMIAASVLQARGYRNFTEIEGGFDTIGKTGLPKNRFICQQADERAVNFVDSIPTILWGYCGYPPKPDENLKKGRKSITIL